MIGDTSLSRGRRAVFFDKDGTLLKDVPYNVDPARMELVEGAGAALRALKQAGFLLFVVSNQSGVARGFFGEADVTRVAEALAEMLGRDEVVLDGFYYCPHLPGAPDPRYAAACECRKPRPGLLFDAARDYGLDLEASWMVGDILNDVEAGNRAGCATILVDVGNETEWVAGLPRTPDHIVANLPEAAAVIVGAGSPSPRRGREVPA